MNVRMRMAPALVCPLCGVRARVRVGSPGLTAQRRGPDGLMTCCEYCASLTGMRHHTHTGYPNPEEEREGTFVPGASWRNKVRVLPIMEDGAHVGYRCSEHSVCGWEQRFTPEERETCPTHSLSPFRPVLRGECVDRWEHRKERGEIGGPYGLTTEHGHDVELARLDADNWDPGRPVAAARIVRVL